MYERHFGLSRPAFRITPDPEFFYAGGSRGAVLEALGYAVQRGEGIVKVVGEVGSGKTMLCRMLERELPADCEIVYLANPRLGPAEILHAIAFELALPVAPNASRLEVMHALQEYLLERHTENRRVVMFVEEAQGIPLESLEEIRMLSNLETTRDKLMQIVLFGQPELDEKLDAHDIRQLRERITHSFELAPFDTAQVRDYVNARVRASGYRGSELFSAGAIRELERHSRGLLRRINVLADKALLAAFAAGARRVEPAHVRLAARDSEFGRGSARRRPALRAAAGAAAVALLVVGAMLIANREFVPPRDDGGDGRATGGQGAAMLDESTAASPAAMEPAAQARRADPVPAVSLRTGLVTDEHLGPRLEPPPARAELRRRWLGE